MGDQQTGTGNLVRYRMGRSEDAYLLARLLDMANDGALAILWRKIAAGGEADPYETGKRIITMNGHSWAPDKAVVAEVDGKLAGALYARPLSAADKPPDLADMEPYDAPFALLRQAAGNALYMENMAVFSEFRRMGLARGLMEFMENVGKRAGMTHAVMIVADTNAPTLGLHKSLGYRHVTSEPVPVCEYYPDGALMHLLKKRLEDNSGENPAPS